MTQLGPVGVETTDPAFSTALPRARSPKHESGCGRAVENAASSNTTNRQHTSKPFVGGRSPPRRLALRKRQRRHHPPSQPIPGSAPSTEHRPSFRLISVLELTGNSCVIGNFYWGSGRQKYQKGNIFSAKSATARVFTGIDRVRPVRMRAGGPRSQAADLRKSRNHAIAGKNLARCALQHAATIPQAGIGASSLVAGRAGRNAFDRATGFIRALGKDPA